MAQPGKPTVSSAPKGAVPRPTTPQKAVVGAQRAPAFTISRVGSRQRYLKLLVYGRYGAGKTVLLASAAELADMRDVLIVDAEAGDLSISLMDMSDDARNSVDVVGIENYQQASRVQEFLKVHCQWRDSKDPEAEDKLIELESRFRGEDVEKPRHYRTVIIDSLTEVETYCMYQLLGVNSKMRLEDEVQAAEWSEYRTNNSMMQRFVRGFRDLPMNVLFTCAEQFIQDESKKMMYQPAMTGKLSKQVQGFMDLVGYIMVGAPGEDGVSPRRLYVQPNANGRFDAKNRFTSFRGAYFDNPTIQSIRKGVGLV